MEKEIEIENFKIRPYRWQELASLYSPEVQPKSAGKRLRNWIYINKKLHAELKKLGWKKGVRLLTPLQVDLLVRYLGPP